MRTSLNSQINEKDFSNMFKLIKLDRLNIRTLCLEAADMFNNWRLKKSKVEDLVLAIEEALTNIFEHGYKKQPANSKEISLEIILIERDVIILINDKADPYIFESCPTVNKSAYLESNIIGGFGIKIIKNLMNSVKLLRIENRNILIMTKEIEYYETPGVISHN
jgi:serine/threonine-protein kinase RsbW